jgi:transposase-like protein
MPNVLKGNVMSSTKVDLTNRIYHDDDKARTHLESLLWPNGPICPHCGATCERITKLKGKSTRPGVYKCKDCRKPFSVTVGTVMERSKVPLSKWVMAAHLMASSKKGMSALQLQRMIGTNYETAWFLFHRLRECTIDPKRGRYLAEFDFRHNHRKASDAERAEALLRGATGKRLTYQQPRKAANN